IAQPAGGPLTGAHKSHQIGLDADIRLHLLEPQKKIKNANQYNSTDVVSCQVHKDKSIDYKFHADRWPISSTQLLQKIASEDNVERIFVSAGIKKYLCESFPDHPSWLQKVRPEWGHTGHLHVRLRCPMGMDTCKVQAPILSDRTDTTDVGCTGNDYKSWFTAATKNKISADCVPQGDKDPTPYWQKVISQKNFPEPCSELIEAKKSNTQTKL
ncbi:MAG: penicillin-insensitive murein endopeptidase, partial [Bdellovibrionaceae bacterium]|nr:penicillin-insensitive murein endopeptidase [Pseudobdellovibrionaceae bacterium]